MNHNHNLNMYLGFIWAMTTLAQNEKLKHMVGQLKLPCHVTTIIGISQIKSSLRNSECGDTDPSPQQIYLCTQLCSTVLTKNIKVVSINIFILKYDINNN